MILNVISRQIKGARFELFGLIGMQSDSNGVRVLVVVQRYRNDESFHKNIGAQEHRNEREELHLFSIALLWSACTNGMPETGSLLFALLNEVSNMAEFGPSNDTNCHRHQRTNRLLDRSVKWLVDVALFGSGFK